MKRSLYLTIFFIFSFFLSPSFTLGQEIPTPEQFFGFRMGTDGELAHWNKIVEYFKLLDDRSDRLIVQNLGNTTLGNPFLMAIFSSPENLKNLEKYREINLKLADPRGLSDGEIENLIKTGKFICAQSYSLHATEVGGTQGTPELAYELVTSNDETIKMILDNDIFLMFPSFNPDGQIMVTEWFYKYKNTEFSNTSLPYLYHFYTGHDDNRDGFMLTQVETQMFAKAIYRDWIPEAYVDYHQMGGNGARIYLPPFVDPIHPNVDPLIWREHQMYGAHMAIALDQAGKSGFETGVGYEGWCQSLFDNTTNYHNIAGMLTESASVNVANPTNVPFNRLGATRGRPGYFPQYSMPRLWPGGEWHLRDIVEQQIIVGRSVLELGARYRENLLRNMVLKAKGNIGRGLSQPPYAYILPKDQHDFLTATKLARIFQLNGIEIHVLNKPYQDSTVTFAPGSYVFSCAQPKRAFVVSFLEQTFYPDNQWTRSFENKSPLQPYDIAAYSMSEYMGVDAIPVGKPLSGIDITKVTTPITPPKGTVTGDGKAYFLEHNSTESIRAVNRILRQKGFEINWFKTDYTYQNKKYPAGTMLIKGGKNLKQYLQAQADSLGLNFALAPDKINGTVYKLKPVRLGLYKRYAGGNMDEGWTNWLLKDFEFTFTSLFNKEIKDSLLYKKYDVIIIPSDNSRQIINGSSGASTPPEYRGGIGDDGVENIKKFVRNGGTLITLNSAWQFARDLFNLPLRNTLQSIRNDDFFCPGSTVKITVDTKHPVAYGMPENALALFNGSPALIDTAGTPATVMSIPVKYQKEKILQSGWLIGEQYLSEKPAVFEYKVGKGKVIILAFPAQYRAQMHGTFKLLFNAIYYGPAGEVILK